MSKYKYLITDMIDQLKGVYESSVEDTSGFCIIKKLRAEFIKQFGPEGTSVDVLFLPIYLIDSLIIQIDIDLSPLSLQDVNSPEFDELMEMYVKCFGKIMNAYLSLSDGLTKEQIINTVTKNFTLKTTEE